MNKSKDDKYIFWLDNLKVLYKNDNYLSIIPSKENTYVENLNAISRICIYYMIILFLFQMNVEYYYISLILLIFMTGLFYVWKYDTTKTDFIQKNNFDVSTKMNNIEIESGYIDSNNKLHIGKYQKKDKPKFKPDFTPDQLLKYQNETCRKPTRDNPFMNPNTVDYNNDDQPVACNSDDDDIKEGEKTNFNLDLYRDVSDLFDIKNSQRQFFTIPNTAIPNDQTGFANWCYKTPSTCKENQTNCLRYEDIRYNRMFPTSSHSSGPGSHK
jgi:hypothetical protein